MADFDVVFDRQDLLFSSYLNNLFIEGKSWITNYWKQKCRPVTKIRIKEKTIGRHEGFIMCVSISNPFEEVRYYAKVQSVHIETVMTHFLLKFTNCGPDAFLIVALPPSEDWYFFSLGVITLEVPQFTMASQMTAEDFHSLSSDSNFLPSQSFLLTFLSMFCHFANIPGNTDNWGFAPNSTSDSSTAEQANAEPARMVLVDFSFPYVFEPCLCDEPSFHALWWATHFSDAYFFDTGVYPLLVDQLKNVPWLQSQKALVQVLQRVLDCTEAWLHRISSFTASNPLSPLAPGALFRSSVCMSEGVAAQLECLLSDFRACVRRWETQCKQLCAWLPFPCKEGSSGGSSSGGTINECCGDSSGSGRSKRSSGSKRRGKRRPKGNGKGKRVVYKCKHKCRQK